MAALRYAPQKFAARVLIFGLATAAACALGGGGVDYASSDPAFPGDFQERHPIVVAAAPTSVDLYPVDGALDERSMLIRLLDMTWLVAVNAVPCASCVGSLNGYSYPRLATGSSCISRPSRFSPTGSSLP